MSDVFVGRGWAFPVLTDATGGIAMVEREREIKEAICLILGTAPGERPMRPEFGCRIHSYVFASPDATTAGLIAHEVRASLRQWEPRIEVTDVVVGYDEANVGLVYIDIHYTVRSTNSRRNLVVPFYTIQGEE